MFKGRVWQRFLRAGLQQARPSAAENPPPMPPVPAGSPMSAESSDLYLQECREAQLDPEDPTTPDKIERIRLEQTCARYGLDPDSETVHEDITRIFMEDFQQEE